MSTTQLCSYLDVPVEDFTNQIALVARGNCTFYEKVRLAQGSGAHGLLIVSKERLVGCSALRYLWGVWKLREPCLRMLRKTEVSSGGTGLWGHGPLSWGWCHWGWRLAEQPLCRASAEEAQGFQPEPQALLMPGQGLELSSQRAGVTLHLLSTAGPSKRQQDTV